MTLSIKNVGYTFLIRLDLMFSLSLLKEFELLQILNNLSIKYLIRLILYGNDLKLLRNSQVQDLELCMAQLRSIKLSKIAFHLLDLFYLLPVH